jgi:hypothetical protein
MSRSKVQKVAPAGTLHKHDDVTQKGDTPIVSSESNAITTTTPVEMVDAIGLVKTAEGWVHATFRVPLSMAVKRTEPEVRFVAVEHFKRDAVYTMIGERT